MDGHDGRTGWERHLPPALRPTPVSAGSLGPLWDGAPGRGPASRYTPGEHPSPCSKTPGNTGTPPVTALHRHCHFYKLRARHSTPKTITASFAGTRVSSPWSGTKPAGSPRYAYTSSTRGRCCFCTHSGPSSCRRAPHRVHRVTTGCSSHVGTGLRVQFCRGHGGHREHGDFFLELLGSWPLEELLKTTPGLLQLLSDYCHRMTSCMWCFAGFPDLSPREKGDHALGEVISPEPEPQKKCEGRP